MRPTIQIGVALLGAAIILAPHTGRAQLTRITQIVDEPNPLLHSGAPAQGYLGVLVGDIDNDSASKLKLKDTRGAVVTLIDHDAPAAQVGLRVNDVLLEVNGQAVEGAEAFGRMMREIPPGRKITMVVSRDGATQTITVQLVDRKKLDTDIWNKLNSGSDINSPVTGLGIFGSGAGGDAPLPGGFHMPFVGNSSLKVGALVEPLTAQMADYLGVGNGLMVKQVARKSQAAVAGMKAFDVILRVGTDNIATVSDWDRAMRSNQGKTVAVTILRDKKQQTVNLLVDSKKKSELEFDEAFPDQDCRLMAFADPDAALNLFADQSAAEEIRNQAEQFRDALKDQNFGIDPKQMDALTNQMQQWSQTFDPKTLGMDMERMGELERQIQKDNRSGAPTFEERQRKQMQQEMDQLKRQMEEMLALGFDHLA
jgi:serine protease Do